MIDDEHRKRRLKVLQQTSATEISSWETCERYWYFQRIEGIWTDKQPHQERGTHVDLRIQRWIEAKAASSSLRPEAVEIGGKQEEHSELVRLMVAKMPDPRVHEVDKQVKISLPTFDGGPKLIGYPDVVHEPEPGWVHIDDAKTTSDFRYTKSRVELLVDTQMVIYGRWGYVVAEANKVSIAHVKGRTKGKPRAHRSFRPHAHPCKCDECRDWLSDVNNGRPVDESPLFLPRDLMEERWVEILNTVMRIGLAARGAASADMLTPSTQHCDRMYGKPCPYRAKCNLPTSVGTKGVKAIMGNLLKRLNASKDQSGDSEEKAQPAPAAEPSHQNLEGYAGKDCNGKGFYKNANGQGFISVEKGHACAQCGGEYPGAGKDPPGKASDVKPVPVVADAVLPPETRDARESTPEEIEAVANAPKRGRKKKEAPAPAPVSKSGETPLETELEEEEQAAVATMDAQKPTSLAEARAQKKAAMPKPAEAPVLYVDCVPVKGDAGAVHLADWLAPLMAAVAEACEVPHVGLADYAKGWSALSVAVREAMGTCPGALVVDSTLPGAKEALAVLVPHAVLVVRGVR